MPHDLMNDTSGLAFSNRESLEEVVRCGQELRLKCRCRQLGWVETLSLLHLLTPIGGARGGWRKLRSLGNLAKPSLDETMRGELGPSGVRELWCSEGKGMRDVK